MWYGCTRMPLLYFVVGAIAGYFVGKHTSHARTAATLHKGANDVLDGVSRMAHTGALGEMDGLHLQSGSAKSGVKLLIKAKTTPALSPAYEYEE